MCEFDLISMSSQEWSTHHWQSFIFIPSISQTLPKLKVMVGPLTKAPISNVAHAHTFFEELFGDALPQGFNHGQVELYMEGYAAAKAMEGRFNNLDKKIVGLHAQLDDLEKEIEEDAADLDEEVQERDCQRRHPGGPTIHQISVKARRCGFQHNRAALAASAASAAHAACADTASSYKLAKASK